MEINVIIAKPKKVNFLISESSAFISFKFNSELIEKIKEIPGRKWLEDIGMWEFEEKYLSRFIKNCPNHHFNIKKVKYDETKQEIKNKIPPDYKFALQPMEHQIEGINFLLNNPKALLADDMGLGKSLQSSYAADIMCKGKVLVIVCSASLKYNWQEELGKYFGEGNAYVLGTRKKIKKKTGEEIEYEGTGADKEEDINGLVKLKEKFIITNKEFLRFKSKQIGRGKYKFPIAEKINEYCSKGIISGIIIDEFHLALKSFKSQTSKALLKIKDCPVKIPMTGTPIMNAPMDIWTVLKWLNIINCNFYEFRDQFAVLDEWHNVIDYKNLDKLKEKIKPYIIRREKREVLKDLPELTIINEKVDMSSAQSRLYDLTLQDLQIEFGKVIEGNPLARLIHLRQCTSNPKLLKDDIKQEDDSKLMRVLELVEEIVSSGHKVLLFSNWTSVTNVYKKALVQYNPAYITGELNAKERDDEKVKFQNDDSCKVCILSTGAGGQGLTLTAANYAIFIDLPYTMGSYNQAIGRLERIGQKNNMTVYNMMCKNTIDENLWLLINSKGQMSDALINDKGEITKGDWKKIIENLTGISLMGQSKKQKAIKEIEEAAKHKGLFQKVN